MTESGKKSEPLDQKQIEIFRSKLEDGWEIIENKKIKRQFLFKDFLEAINFINKIAKVAEELDHHPDISVYYNKVIIEIWTHKVGGLTELDFDLAEEVEMLK